MTETPQKIGLAQRIQAIKDNLHDTALAYKRWQQDVDRQSNTRNASQQAFRNHAITAGSLAGDIIEVMDELSNRNLKLNEVNRKEHENYVAAKKELDALRKEFDRQAPGVAALRTGTPFDADVMTAVVPDEAQAASEEKAPS